MSAPRKIVDRPELHAASAVRAALGAETGMDALNRTTTDNRLLDLLDASTWSSLTFHMEEVELRRGQELVRPNRPIEFCYFVTSGIASIIATDKAGAGSEVGLVGRDGFLPVAPILGVDATPLRAVTQIEGQALRIRSANLFAAADKQPALRLLLNRYIFVLLMQAAGTAFANANHTVEQRLARWILMCHDRVSGDRIALTHEFLAIMLAVRRPSVTTALHALEGEKMIISERGLLVVRDRGALEAFAGSVYGQPEAEYQRLIGRF
jgi:CRP-like cAMP-binding protein